MTKTETIPSALSDISPIPIKTVEQVQAIIKSVEKAIENEDIAKLTDLISELTHGINTFGYSAKDLHVFRARLINSEFRPTDIREMSFAPSELITKHHRVGTAGEAVFYSSLDFLIAIAEIRPVVGDYVLVSEWQSHKDLFFNCIGFGTQQYEDWGHISKNGEIILKKQSDRLIEKPELLGNKILLDYIYSKFTKVIDQSNDKNYQFTSVFAKALGFDTNSTSEFATDFSPSGNMSDGPPFDGLLYPSIEGLGRSENFAIRKHTVERYMSVVNATVYEVIGLDGLYPKIREVDFGNIDDQTELFKWHGRPAIYSTSAEAGEVLKFEYTERGWESKTKPVKRS